MCHARKKDQMMEDAPSKSAIFLAWLAAVVVVVFIALGIVWHGFSAEAMNRLWRDLLARPGGPMMFRFILQPAMAAVAALHDGIKDARLGRSPYFWTIMHNSHERGARLREGLISTARIILLGLGMDAVYQYEVLKTFYPGEAVIIALLLAFVPYILLRGPIARIARRWIARRMPCQSNSAGSPNGKSHI
jgi:hypothetical protein